MQNAEGRGARGAWARGARAFAVRKCRRAVGLMEVAGIEPAGARGRAAVKPNARTRCRTRASADSQHSATRFVVFAAERSRVDLVPKPLPGFGSLRAHPPDTELPVAQDADDLHRRRRKTGGTNSAAQPRAFFATGTEAADPALRQMERRDCARCSCVCKMRCGVALARKRNGAVEVLGDLRCSDFDVGRQGRAAKRAEQVGWPRAGALEAPTDR